MLISLVAWIYISIICLIWGQMTLAVLVKTKQSPKFSFSAGLICLAGLSSISVLALGLSLFMPLDWKAQFIILLPATGYLLKRDNRQAFKTQAGQWLTSFSPTGYCLLASCILLILTISVYKIEHPDTLTYHAKSILLFKRYTPVPGIANLKVQLGFQSSWFAAMALFQWDSPLFYNVTFLNGAVLCWFFIGIVQKISRRFRWPWFLLLSYTLLSWTQIRLTAASASPDFIVTLYVWAAIYAYLEFENKQEDNRRILCLVWIFCTAAFLIKLSAIAILLLGIVIMVRFFRLRQTWSMVLFSAIGIGILLTRNFIASGYPFYPVSLPNIGPADWRMKAATLHTLQQYITTYARFPVSYAEAATQYHASLQSWIPLWWEEIGFPDRLLLLGIAAGILIHLATLLKRKKYPLVLWLAAIGSLLWFLQAPHPRFGTGFLIPLVYFLYRTLPLPFLQKEIKIPFLSRHTLYVLATGCLLMAIGGYTVFRCVRFLTPSELIRPTGIMASAYDPDGCENIQVDIKNNKIVTRNNQGPIVCFGEIGSFTPRGSTIGEGFKPAE